MSGEARYFIFREDKVLVPAARQEITAFTAGDWLRLQAHAATILPLDKGPGSSDFAVELDPDFETGEGFEWMGLRRLLGRIADAEFDAWGKAAQLLRWHATHRYCGRCGQATIAHARRWSARPVHYRGTHGFHPASSSSSPAAKSCCWRGRRASRRGCTAPSPVLSSRASRWKPQCTGRSARR